MLSQLNLTQSRTLMILRLILTIGYLKLIHVGVLNVNWLSLTSNINRLVVQCTIALRSYIKKSDKVLIRNTGKKKLSGTKTQPRYFGPYDVENVTKGHVVVSKSDKSRRFPSTSLRSIYNAKVSIR